ncbi:MAG: hypothetical protein R3E53_12830 [Myxococcota bacterium]
MQSFAANLDARQARAVIAEDEDIDALEGTVIREAIARIREGLRLEQRSTTVFIRQEPRADRRPRDEDIAEEVVLAAEALNLKHAEKLSRWAFGRAAGREEPFRS